MNRSRLQLALLAFGVAFAGFVAFSFRPGHRSSGGASRPGDVPPPRDAGPATSVSSGFDFTESVKGKPLFRIRAKKTAGFGASAIAGASPELYAGEGVTLTLYPEDGKPVTVESDRAEYDARRSSAVLEGNVRWADGKGGVAETSRVRFASAEHALYLPEKVHFVRGPYDVRARSGRYDVAEHRLALDGPVDGTGTGAAGALSKLRADAASYRKEQGLVDLTGNVDASSEQGDTIHADAMVLKLSDPEGKLEWARANGSVRGTIAAVHAEGGRPGQALRPYAGDEAAFFFDAAGQLRSLTLTGNPAQASEPERRITARKIEIEYAEGRPRTARARGDVRLTSAGEEASADSGDLALGADGTAEGLSLVGGVRLRGANRSGRAQSAVQLPGKGVWVLTGDGRVSATVEQDGSRVSAPRIEIEDATKLLRAEGGGTRAVLAPSRDGRANPTLVGDSSKPTFAKAERMVFDQNGKTATLSGKAAVWQESSSLFGRDITLNDVERSVVSTGDARAVLAPDPSAKRLEDRRPTVLTASRLLYREAPPNGDAPGKGDVTLEGGVTAARGPWHASAENGKVLLTPERRVERVTLSGSVVMTDAAAGRNGRADHAEDFPAEGRTLLTGTPAIVTDREGNRVAGASLTITERGNRVEVTAPDGGKTETVYPTHRDR